MPGWIYTTMAPKFIDAQAMHRKYPKSFGVPSKRKLDALKPRSVVKVCNGKERFWTVVRNVRGSQITATVDNALVDKECGYKAGDTITFEKRHIYDINPKLAPIGY